MTNDAKRSSSPVPSDLPEITPEMVAYYIRYGNHLRAAVLGAMMSRAWHRLARPWSRDVPALSQDEMVAERFATALTAIRASAENLRDVPDMSPADRARFVQIVLEEERRLEALLGEIRRRDHGSARTA